RPAVRLAPRRRHHHRGGLRAPRPRHAPPRGDPHAQLPGGAGLRASRRRRGRRGERLDRPRLRRRRPADPSVMKCLSPAAWLGAALLAGFVLVALLGPPLAPSSPTHSDLGAKLLGPSAAHPLGTDENGVDLLSEMLYGARVALEISGIVVLTCAFL